MRRTLVPLAVGTAVLVALAVLVRESFDVDDVTGDKSASPSNNARSDSLRNRPGAWLAAVPEPDLSTLSPESSPAESNAAPAASSDDLPTTPPARGIRHRHRRRAGGHAAAAHVTEGNEASNHRRDQKAGPKLGQKLALAGAASKHDAEWQRPPSNEDSNSKLVARFAPTGGATLKGRVIDAESGKPPNGVAVEAHIGDNFMKTTTDGAGVFRMSGMLPGHRITVWIIGRSDTFVAERLDVTSPGEGETADAGVVRLLLGDELTSHLEGWTGVFVNRRGQRNVVAAVSPWSPADRAGIEVGDVLLSIAGRDVDGLGPRATGFLLRGPVGTKVSVAVLDRHGLVQRFQLERVLR